jgi:hypothetical protein
VVPDLPELLGMIRRLLTPEARIVFALTLGAACGARTVTDPAGSAEPDAGGPNAASGGVGGKGAGDHEMPPRTASSAGGMTAVGGGASGGVAQAGSGQAGAPAKQGVFACSFDLNFDCQVCLFEATVGACAVSWNHLNGTCPESRVCAEDYCFCRDGACTGDGLCSCVDNCLTKSAACPAAWATLDSCIAASCPACRAKK